jgi:hypothetical protein
VLNSQPTDAAARETAVQPAVPCRRIVETCQREAGAIPGGRRRVFVWHTVRGLDGRIETVDGWESLDALLAGMATSSWEEPGNGWASYVTDDVTGEVVVVVAIFGPGLELLVTVADGR